MIVDGDDELVGRLPFQLINSYYQKDDNFNWIVYTNYITSTYELGASYFIPKSFKKSPILYRKIPKHMMGPIRTFYTELFRHIKEEDHKFKNGKWLDTMYDDAMQYPMLEMSG